MHCDVVVEGGYQFLFRSDNRGQKAIKSHFPLAQRIELDSHFRQLCIVLQWVRRCSKNTQVRKIERILFCLSFGSFKRCYMLVFFIWHTYIIQWNLNTIYPAFTVAWPIFRCPWQSELDQQRQQCQQQSSNKET